MEIPGPEKRGPEGELDRAVARLGAVWVWTVMFAASSALTAGLVPSWGTSMWNQMMMQSMMGGGMPGQFGGGGGLGPIYALVVPVAGMLGMGAILYSWICQLRYFRGHVVPVVLLRRTAPDAEDRANRAMRDLGKAYLLLIVAGVCRLLPEVVMGLLPLMSL